MKRNHNTHALMILAALSALGASGIMRGSHWSAQAEEQATAADARSLIYGRPLLQSRGHDAPNRTREEST